MRIDVEGASVSTLVDLISQGSEAALAVVIERTSGVVRVALPASFAAWSRSSEVLAATYLEVWWLAGSHGGPEADVMDWIIGIARRRYDDMAGGVSDSGTPPSDGGLRPSHAEVEIAALLRRPLSELLAM